MYKGGDEGLTKTASISAGTPAYITADSRTKERLEKLNGKIILSDSNEELLMALVLLLSHDKSIVMVEKAVERWGALSIRGVKGGGFSSETSQKDGSIVIDLNQSKVAFEIKFTGGYKLANAIIDGKMPGFYSNPDSDGGQPFYTPFSLIRALAHELGHSAYGDFSSVVDDENKIIGIENEMMKLVAPGSAERVLCHGCWKNVKDLEK